MKTFYITSMLALFGLSNLLNAQNLNFSWAKQVSGISNEQGNSVAVDSKGNVYTIGSFYGPTDFDPGIGVNILTSILHKNTSNYSEDIFVLKLDKYGNFIWARRMGGTSDDSGNGITVDANGNVYTTGLFYYDADFGPYTLTGSLGGSNVFVSKLDSSGNFLWAKQLGTGGVAIGTSIAVNTSGNVSVTGSFSGTGDFDPGPNTNNLTSAGGKDIFISTLDPSGGLVWTKQIGSSFDDVGNSIAVDAIGNVYTTGYFSSQTDFDPGAATHNLPNGGIFISKLDQNGIYVWAKQIGGNPDVGNSIAVNANNVYITGTFNGNADFDPGPNSYSLNTGGSDDIFVEKLKSSDGSFVWAKQLGGQYTDQGYSIALDASENVYTTGSFANTADFDPGSGSVPLTSPSYFSFFVSILNSNGNYLWAGQVGGAGGYFSSYSIAVDNDKNIYTTGAFDGTGDFDPTNGSHTLISDTGLSGSSSYDIFVEKLCQIETPTISGPTSFCLGSSITLTSSGTIGSTYKWSDGQITKSISVSTSGNYSVTVTNASGCTAVSAVTTIIGNPLPTTPIITITPPGTPTFCQGQSVTLTTSSQASSYKWNNNAGTTQSIIVTTSGTYIVTITNSAGCTAASLPKILMVNPLPAIPEIKIDPLNQTTFCQGMSVILSSTQANKYLWTGGSVNQNITVTTSGNYYVTITDINQCTAVSFPVMIKVNPIPIVTVKDVTICEGQSATLAVHGAKSYLWNYNNNTDSIIIVSPNTTTTYSVIGTKDSCSSIPVNAKVTVNPLPIITSNDTTICAGQSAMLKATGATTYIWNGVTPGNSITVSPNINSTYTVIGTKLGCLSIPFTVQVTVNPAPIVYLGPDKTMKDSAVLDAGPNLTFYHWWPNGENTRKITVKKDGIYWVKVTNSFGCTASDTIMVTIIVSTNEINDKYKISVSPNPTSGLINISFQGAPTSMVQIIDNLGKLVVEDKTIVPDCVIRTLSLKNFPPGTYYLRIVGDGFTRTVSVIKQ